MQAHESIISLIPHRPPFLWVDRILESSDESVVTEKHIDEDLPIFSGHYPGNPIFPGALLCEALFQSGALLIALRQSSLSADAGGIPLVTRILGAKFKKAVHPGDLLRMTVSLTEYVANAYYFHGVVRVGTTIAATADFACMLQKPPP